MYLCDTQSAQKMPTPKRGRRSRMNKLSASLRRLKIDQDVNSQLRGSNDRLTVVLCRSPCNHGDPCDTVGFCVYRGSRQWLSEMRNLHRHDNYPSPVVKVVKPFTRHCPRHKDQEVDYYCHDHDEAYCESCRWSHHDDCDDCPVDDVCSSL